MSTPFTDSDGSAPHANGQDFFKLIRTKNVAARPLSTVIPIFLDR